VSGTGLDNIRNERVKLTATYLNAAAGSLLTLGVLTPLAAAFFLPAPVGFGLNIRLSEITLAATLWLAASAALHLAARWTLRSLRQ
jgi:VIT1/CCC1 family predicted Fe2+/Mn2+ transporter